MKKFISIILMILLNSSTTVFASSFYTLPEVNREIIDTNLQDDNILYPIKINGKYGFLDINGLQVIKPKFIEINRYGMDYGYYIAYTSDKKYIPNKSSIPINETYLICPNNKVIKISDEKIYEVNFTENKRYIVTKNKNIRFIFDLETEKLFDKSTDSYEIIDAFDNCYIIKASQLYYIKDYNNNIISPGFESFEGHTDGTFFFKNASTLYFLDEKGKQILYYKNGKSALPFYKDVTAIIDNDSNLLFINKNKKILNQYSNILSIKRMDNTYLMKTNDNYEDYTILNFDGSKKTGDHLDGRIILNEKDPIAIYNEKTSLFTVLNEDGDVKNFYKIPEGYLNPSLIEDLIKLGKNGLYGLCKVEDDEVEWLIEPEYVYFSELADEQFVTFYSGVTKNFGLYDVLNKKLILDAKYKAIQVYDTNMIYVQSAYYSGYMDSNGQFIYVQLNFNL